MILQTLPLSLLLLFSHSVLADDNGFDCAFNIGATKYDLNSLAGVHEVTRERSTPPTTMVDTVRFNLCHDLPINADVDAKDQCPSGTHVCLTKSNKKEGHTDRVVSVIPIAQTASLDASSTSLTSPKGISIVFHGPEYPTSESKSQKFVLSLVCSTENGAPTITSYDGAELALSWSVPEACGDSNEGKEGDTGGGGEEPKDPKKRESVGSGIGWFFLVLFLALATYFGVGAYYNYSTYGASGMDLVPHRDFWQEVPYMLRDVVSHLCSTVRPRRTSSRGGYISV
ncbi:autophagy-related protein 27 [Mycena floridula]|nr:autophagy-related protein 27 [Mycena floridula]